MNYFLYKKLNSKYKDFTMIPFNLYSDNLEIADKFRNIPGAVVECGVWRGGMIASIAELMGKDREYFLFDSFEGLPSAGALDGKEATDWQGMKDSKHYYDNCAAEMKFAEQAMKLAGINKPNIVKGWFNETISKTTTGPISTCPGTNNFQGRVSSTSTRSRRKN